MASVNERPRAIGAKPYQGYHHKVGAEPDMFLAAVERGTPGGEFLRRFWVPIAYEHELGRVPLRVRALGEDLVAFRDLSGRYGLLHLNCTHRNTSLEYGLLTENGIQCCYHGREYAVDGSCVAIPGDPLADRLKPNVNQGAYPTHTYGGILFAYMGPPDRVPVFPMYDRLDLPGVRVETGHRRLELECNWLQQKENVLDPHHTAILHLIPLKRGGTGFAAEFGNSPEFTFLETDGGSIYLGVRAVGENVWVRCGESLYPLCATISSVFENGHKPKYSAAPYMTLWTLPVDNDRSIQFFINHMVEGDAEQNRRTELFGQYHNDRSYDERQWVPGDVDAQESQGPINVHAKEHLGSLDRGVVLFRKLLRAGIEAVRSGEDPKGFYLSQDDVPPTYAGDFIAPAAELGVDVNDVESLRGFMTTLWERYQTRPPMREWRERFAATSRTDP